MPDERIRFRPIFLAHPPRPACRGCRADEDLSVPLGSAAGRTEAEVAL